MRIGVAGLFHESNTFAYAPTTLENYRIYEGREIIEQYSPTFHEIAGFIDGAKQFGYELYPLVSADATPAGPLTADTYENLVKRLLAAIENAPKLDGLLLALHGAMVSEAFLHADAETVRRVRRLLPPP